MNTKHLFRFLTLVVLLLAAVAPTAQTRVVYFNKYSSSSTNESMANIMSAPNKPTCDSGFMNDTRGRCRRII